MKQQRQSIIISWLGFKNGLVKQDVVKVRKGETPEEAVEVFRARLRGERVARIVGWRVW